MFISPEILDFAREHLNDDPDKLQFQQKKYPDKRVTVAVEQIRARERIRAKLPSWHANTAVFYPSGLATEQCSSEITANYKARLVAGGPLCDLTGGMGVDSYFFSRAASRVTYVEQNPLYCEAACHNFQVLGAGNIEVIHGDATRLAGTLAAETYYIDPSRRTRDNRRLFALADYEPNVLEIKERILSRGSRLIVKMSPMEDISAVASLLPETTGIHVLSVKNECKELLFVLEATPANKAVSVHAVNFTSAGREQHFTFTPEEEKEAPSRLTDSVGRYLYEPNSAILKSGAFKLPATRYALGKLHRHSHLYTGDSLESDFPGRVFQVREVFDFSSKWLKQIAKTLPRANITTRNFKLSADEIRSRGKIKDGGNIYLFATTMNNGKAVVILAEKN